MKPPAAGTTLAHAVMSVIRAHGIDTIFGIPGTHNLELYRPLEPLGFRVVTTRHEQGSVFAADGWAATTGKPGVVITTSGPGLLNALSAAAMEWAESRPLLLLSPGEPRGSARAARIGALHETKDAVGAAGSVLTWSRRVTCASSTMDALADAFALFATERPGPVHIELPRDLMSEPWPAPVPHLPEPRPLPLPPADDLEHACSLLTAAAQPVILAGGGAAGAGAALRALAERLGAPIITTVNGKGTVPETHPLVVGSDIRLPRVQDLVAQADALLVVGSDIGDAELWGGALQPAGPLLRIDLDESQARDTLSPTLCLIGDAKAVLNALLDRITADAPRPVWADVVALRTAVRAEVRAAQPELARIADGIAAAIPDDAIIGGDSSRITYLATSSLFPTSRPRQLLYMPTYATLGYGLPAALGAKLAAPERCVLALVGDGALMFSIQEFVTAVEQKVCLPVICVDNGGYEEIRESMIDDGIAPMGVDLVQPDWPALARALGGAGFTATAENVGAVVREALQLDCPSIVHVTVSRNPVQR